MRYRWVIVVAASFAHGCATQKQPPPVETCTRAGESCAYAPGKLGICVETVSGQPRFLCQSQH